MRRELAAAQRLYWQGLALQLGAFVVAALVGIAWSRSAHHRPADAAFVGLLALSVYGTAIRVVAIRWRESLLRDIACRQLATAAEQQRTLRR